MGVSRIGQNKTHRKKEKHKAGQGDMIDTWDLKKVMKKGPDNCEMLR